MKKLLSAYLPALALFALGGCASTSGLTSTEDDGVYYSSRDRTTAVMRPAPVASSNEAANPDYNGNTGAPSARQGSGSSEYYDNTYTYMQGVQPGVSYYTPYSPYTTLNYGASSYGYGGGYGYGGYSPYGGAGFYDPFYSPFYSPYGYGYGSGLTISFGFGRPWGYGSSFGYGRSYGYGGFYDPYFYGGPFYGGYYGRGGYYGNNYYGGNQGGYYGSNNGYYGSNNGYYGGNDGRGRSSGGHRNYRSSDGRYQSGSGAAGTASGNNAGGGRIRPDGLLSPTTGQDQAPAAAMDARRSRPETLGSVSETRQDRANGSFNQPSSISGADQPRYRDMDQPTGRQLSETRPANQNESRERAERNQADQNQPTREDSRGSAGRWRNADAAGQLDQMQPANAQPENTRRRGGFFQGNGGEQPRSETTPQALPEQSRSRSYEQPQQSRSYEQPRESRRSYEQPQQPQQSRSYEQPRESRRSYEQPQRSYSQPSYSSPSGGGGGSRSGGGGSRGRGE